MRYIKVFYQKIVSRQDSSKYWFAYTQQPTFQCKAKVGKLESNFNLTVRNSITNPMIMWLGDVSDKEAELMKKVYGSQCYIELDADNNGTLVKELPEGGKVIEDWKDSSVSVAV